MTTETNRTNHRETPENTEEPKPEARFAYLLGTIVVLIIFLPFHRDALYSVVLLAVLNSLILVVAAFAASHSRRTLVFALLLAAPAVLLGWLEAISRDPLVAELRYVALVAIYGFTIYHILVDVLRPGDVTLDKIAGAIAAYMLIAVAWATLYALTDAFVPGSFAVQGESDKAAPLGTTDFLYFSFTTLTTTGYGDITPLSTHARSLAILEQQTGTFYVAILIARLAGLYRPGASKSFVDDMRRLRRGRDRAGK